MRFEFHEMPLATSGNQKCRGAAPIFIKMAELIRIEVKLFNSKLKSLSVAKKTIENRRMNEAIA